MFIIIIIIQQNEKIPLQELEKKFPDAISRAHSASALNTCSVCDKFHVLLDHIL